MWLPLMLPLLGTWLATQARAPTENQNGDPLVCRPALNPRSHTSQGNETILKGSKYKLWILREDRGPLARVVVGVGPGGRMRSGWSSPAGASERASVFTARAQQRPTRLCSFLLTQRGVTVFQCGGGRGRE